MNNIPSKDHPLIPNYQDPAFRNLKKRRRSEQRFMLYGRLAIAFCCLFLAMLFMTIINHGLPAFRQTQILLPIHLDAQFFGADRSEAALAHINYRPLVAEGLSHALPNLAPEVLRLARPLLSKDADYELRDFVIDHPEMIGQRIAFWFTASDSVDSLFKRHGLEQTITTRLTTEQQAWLKALADRGEVRSAFNSYFFTNSSSREPELAGIQGAMVGSLYLILVCLAVAFPVGVATAVYLEEFARKNKWTSAIELNINNLAAVPSIVYGILALEIFLNYMDLPRSSPLVGGLALALLVLPVMIVTTRSALGTVSPALREAAIGIGASKVQVVFHHMLPAAMPGIMTGTILAIARALGETAPLIMIGMVAFVADVPEKLTHPAAALPVQIYLWSDSPEQGFQEKTAAAILVLLGFLLVANIVASVIRKKSETKW